MKKLSLHSMATMEDNGFKTSAIFKSVFVSYILCIILLGIFSIVLTYTDFPESSIPTVVLTITIISIIFAAQMTARHAKSRGWLIGGATGAVFMIFLYIISSIFSKSVVFDSHAIIIFLLSLFAGAIGGIIGINLKKPEKRHR